MSTHFDAEGNVHMVDVSAKGVTPRVAVASGDVTMDAKTAESIRSGETRKGDVLAVARLAAIQATKVTSQLIPLCHGIPVEGAAVTFQWLPQAEESEKAVVRCQVTVRTTARTGVEMEAMTAASVACLTIYDMAKSLDRAIVIGPIQLREKSGGKSGHFLRDPPAAS